MDTKKSLYEIIADELENLIVNDSSQIEQKLPSENILATSFGVSRPVIREAIKLLKERGIISLRQGSASVISRPGVETIINPVKRMILFENITPQQVYEMRMILEISSIRLASHNVTDEDIAELEVISEKMLKADSYGHERTELDIKFHTKIAEMSNNPLLKIFIESISTLIYSTIKPSLLAESPKDHAHQLLIECLKSGSEETCVTTMRKHLLNSMRNFQTVSDLAEGKKDDIIC